MSYIVFMLTLTLMMILCFIDMLIDDKYDINDKFINWLSKKLERWI